MATAKNVSIAVPATADRGTAATIATRRRATVSTSQSGFRRQSIPASPPISFNRVNARASIAATMKTIEAPSASARNRPPERLADQAADDRADRDSRHAEPEHPRDRVLDQRKSGMGEATENGQAGHPAARIGGDRRSQAIAEGAAGRRRGKPARRSPAATTRMRAIAGQRLPMPPTEGIGRPRFRRRRSAAPTGIPRTGSRWRIPGAGRPRSRSRRPRPRRRGRPARARPPSPRRWPPGRNGSAPRAADHPVIARHPVTARWDAVRHGPSRRALRAVRPAARARAASATPPRPAADDDDRTARSLEPPEVRQVG